MEAAQAGRRVPQGTRGALGLLAATLFVGLLGVQQANHGGCDASLSFWMLLGLGLLALPAIAIVCVAVRRFRHPGWMVPTVIRIATFVLVVVFFRSINTIQVETYYGGCD